MSAMSRSPAERRDASPGSEQVSQRGAHPAASPGLQAACSAWLISHTIHGRLPEAFGLVIQSQSPPGRLHCGSRHPPAWLGQRSRLQGGTNELQELPAEIAPHRLLKTAGDVPDFERRGRFKFSTNLRWHCLSWRPEPPLAPEGILGTSASCSRPNASRSW
jgi:hypothetical protein